MAVINTPFLVTGGGTYRPPSNAFSPSQRQINIRAPFSVPSADQSDQSKSMVADSWFHSTQQFF